MVSPRPTSGISTTSPLAASRPHAGEGDLSEKVALITGVTGQDGSLLARLLWIRATSYTASSGARPPSTPVASTTSTSIRMRESTRFFLHYGDMTDATNLIRILQDTRPHEIYNLAAQSHVQVSFETPEYTANADALGTLRLLEAMRILGLEESRFYQASTSELYGKVMETPQSETTPFYPRSPYGVAKLYAYWITVNYREAYGLFASNGILFNHESPVRGETFVTRKITRAVAAIERACRTLSISGTSTRSATGDMPRTSSRACGSSCSSRSRTTTSSLLANATACANSSSSPLRKSDAPSRGREAAKMKSVSTETVEFS